MTGNFCPRWKRNDSLESDCQAPFILCTLIAECATQRTRILGDQRLAWARSADVWRHGYGWISLRELQHLLRLGDFGLGGLGEEATAFQLPFLLVLQQLAAHQPHDRRVVGDDADHVDAALDGQLR